MQALPALEWQQARAALAVNVPRLTGLMRSIRRPEAHAVGEWCVRDVAVHMGHVWSVLSALAREEALPPLESITQLPSMTVAMVASDSQANVAEVADGIDAAAREFIPSMAGGVENGARPWLVGGTTADSLTFACHLLNETLVHGYDMARGEGVPWPIEPAHAALVLRRFLFPTMGKLDPRALVIQEKAAGFRARYEIRIRDSCREYLEFDDGEMRVLGERPGSVDCVISAAPAALFLVMWGRESQWKASRRGQLLAWGRKPWLGPRLRELVKNP